MSTHCLMYGVVLKTSWRGAPFRETADYVTRLGDVDHLMTWLLYVNGLVDLPPADSRRSPPRSVVDTKIKAQADSLREKGWSLDCGLWIFKGDSSAAFTLEAAIARQKGHDRLPIR